MHLETSRLTDFEIESLVMLLQKKKKDSDDELEVGSDNDIYDPYSNEDDSEKAQEGKVRLEKCETKQTNKNEKERQQTTV